MNRRQKIIVSVTGIFIVLLILVGLTYAYFLTRINGNPNNTSITVTTANLELVYGDGNGNITLSNILPGDPIPAKTFTVSNKGNATVEGYKVYLENVQNQFEYKSDVTYTLTCASYTTEAYEDYLENGTALPEAGTCNGVSTATIFPDVMTPIVSNDIAVGITHLYSLQVVYANSDTRDQSIDMNKLLSAKVNIYDGKAKFLATEIINNAKDNKNGTKLLNTSLTKVAEEISVKGTGEVGEIELDMSSQSEWYYGLTAKDAQPWNGGMNYGSTTTCSSTIEKKYISYPTISDSWYVKSCKSETIAIVEVEIMEYESSLLTTQDDLGTSYFYRGSVEDNYVNFADMCWRIVRIAGDGSIKLILEDQDQPCSTSINGNWAIQTTTGGSTYTGNFGYTEHSSNTLTASDGTNNSSAKSLMNYLHGETDSASSMATAFKNFQGTFTETELSKLKSGNWCLGDNAYDSSTNLLNSTQIMDNKIKGTSFNYDSYQRLGGNNGYQPTLKCNGTIMNDWEDNNTNPTPMYVGAITADEVAYAGGKYGTANQNYYLINEGFKKGIDGVNKARYFWCLTPDYFDGHNDYAFGVVSNGVLGIDGFLAFAGVGSVGAFRPSVSLASSAVFLEGEGTIDKPYIIG